jgi:L-lysine exporter family protein LysE/ArgO
MILAFSTGFFLGFSLILAIGAQNAFVLRQGVLRQHVFYVALFCASADALLICIGISGISFFFNNFIDQFSNLIFGFSSIWLIGYGVVRLISAFKSNSKIEVDVFKKTKLLPTLSTLSILTFANPHVYLDTVILIGSVSQQFSGLLKTSFAIGAIFASYIFFFTLAYGASLLIPRMQKPSSWRILDLMIALIMFTIAIKLAYEGNWL